MSPTYVKTRHDIGFLRSDDVTKVGMMLAEIDGKPAYRTLTERYLKNQYYAGAPDYGALDPQSELPIIIDDWRSGFGLEVADSADPKRYYSSIGMDLRHRGMAMAGWTPTTVTIPTHTVSDWNSPVFHKDVDGDWSTEAQAYDGDTGTSATVTLGVATYCGFLELYIPAISCSKIRFFYGTQGTGTIDVDVYYNGAWNGITATTETEGSYVEKSLGATYTVTAARVRLKGSASGGATLNEFGFYAESATVQGTVVAFADFNDEYYAAYANALLKLNAGGTAFTVVEAFRVNITDLAPMNVSGTDYLFIALGVSNPYWYMDTATPSAFLESDATNKTYQFFALVNTASPTLYGNDSGNTIRSTVDPLNAGTAWSVSATTVDSTYYDITDLIAWKGSLYIMKEDKPYYLDSSSNVQSDLARELESAQATTSGKNAWVWKNKLYIPCGDQAVLETDATTNVFRNPANYCTNLSDFVGQVYAGAGDEEYNYLVVENASTTEVEILAGRQETIGSTTSWVYHPIAEIALKGCECCHISTKVTTAFSKVLWIASDDATDSLYYLQLPTTYGDIENDANRKFNVGSPYFITPYYHGNFKGENKAWRKITLTMGHTYIAGAQYFTVHYQTLEGSEVSVGNFTGSETSMTQSRYIDVTNKPVSSMMRFKITAVTDNTDYTPILLSLDIRATLRPPRRKIIECVVRCADGILDKQGNKLEGTNAEYIRTVLDEAGDADWYFTFYDVFGATKYGIMLPNEPESEMQKWLKGQNPELYYYLRIQEVALS